MTYCIGRWRASEANSPGGVLRAASLVIAFFGLLFSATAAMAVVPILVEIGIYVASTAGIAVSVSKLSGAIAGIYSNSAPLIDDQVCRKHKAALKDLVINFRDVEGDKKIFGRTLDDVVRRDTLTAISWSDLSSSSSRVANKLRVMQGEVESQKALFRDQPAISSTYADLRDIVDQKIGILAQIENINWNDSIQNIDMQADPADRQELQKLSIRFAAALKSLDNAINQLAAEADKPCPTVSRPQ